MTNWDRIAFEAGRYAFRSGRSISDNPNNQERDTWLYDSWEEGWIKASNERVRQ